MIECSSERIIALTVPLLIGVVALVVEVEHGRVLVPSGWLATGGRGPR
jgi:hypothetical protein